MNDIKDSTTRADVSDANLVVKGLALAVTHELQALRKHWWCLLVLGIILIVCGLGAVTYPFISSVGVTIAVGLVLLIGGASTIVTSFWTGKWSAFLVQLLVGIFYVVLGLSMTESPVVSTVALTLLVASFSIAGGIFRIVAALALRFPQWGWVLVNGLITMVFGVIVLRHFPEASLMLIGLMVGFDMIFAGLNWLMLSLEVRSLPKISE